VFFVGQEVNQLAPERCFVLCFREETLIQTTSVVGGALRGEVSQSGLVFCCAALVIMNVLKAAGRLQVAGDD
jgi:hypothetical protein